MTGEPKPVVVHAPNALDVDAQHQNRIVIAQVFTVMPGTASKRDEAR